MKRNNSRQLAIWALAIALTATTIAYAALQTSLSITGNVTRKGGSWNVKLGNVANKSTTGSAKFTTQPTISGTTLNFGAELALPGDSFTFTFDVMNAGTVDAKLSSYLFTDSGFDPDNVGVSKSEIDTEYNVHDVTCNMKYNNAIITWSNKGNLNLTKPASTSSPTKKTITVYCKYNYVTTIESYSRNLGLSLELNYVQA